MDHSQKNKPDKMASTRRSQRIAMKQEQMKLEPEQMKQEPGLDLKQEEGMYYIQKIVNKRIVNGVVEYRVRWQGYRSSEDTWEDASKLKGFNCVKHYEDGLKTKGVGVVKSRLGGTNTTSVMQLLVNLTTDNTSADENDDVVIEDASAAPRRTSMITEEDFGGDSTDDDDDVVMLGAGGKRRKVRNRVEDHYGDAGSVPLEEPYPGKLYKVQWGPVVEEILSVTRLGSRLVALVQYEDSSYEIVPTKVLADYCPKLLFAYYESRLLFPA